MESRRKPIKPGQICALPPDRFLQVFFIMANLDRSGPSEFVSSPRERAALTMVISVNGGTKGSVERRMCYMLFPNRVCWVSLEQARLVGLCNDATHRFKRMAKREENEP